MAGRNDLHPRVQRLEVEVDAIRGEMQSGFDSLRQSGEKIVSAVNELREERQRDLQNKIERVESRRPQWSQLALTGFAAAAFFALIGNGIMMVIDLRTAPLSTLMSTLTTSVKADFASLSEQQDEFARNAVINRQKQATMESNIADLKRFQHWLIYEERAPERTTRIEAKVESLRRELEELKIGRKPPTQQMAAPR